MMKVQVTALGATHLIYGQLKKEGDVLSLRKDNATYLIEIGWAVPVAEEPLEGKKPRRSPSSSPEAA
jgi:hypothetical protein